MQPDDIFYVNVQAADVPELVEETLVKGRVVERLTYKDPATRKFIHHYSDIPSQRKQMRVALRHCGLINPESIDEYIAVGGYEALSQAFAMKPEQIIEEIKTSGLRGRGGAGFPTGRKWESARKAEGDIKYIIANGDEGDPDCFMDRALMEGDPIRHPGRDDDWRLRGWRSRRIHLPALRIHAGGQDAQERHPAGARVWPAGQEHPGIGL